MERAPNRHSRRAVPDPQRAAKALLVFRTLGRGSTTFFLDSAFTPWHFFCGLTKQNFSKGEKFMRAFISFFGLSTMLLTSGCYPAFWGGAAAGALGTGAGYEVQANRQMDRLDDDLRSGKISRREYETRKQQIERGSVVY
jgi:hypothetical protein